MEIAQPQMPSDDVDFETAVGDPAAYYADPQAVVADAQLGLDQKRRFLTDWAQDIADRQTAAAEGMDEGMGAEHASAADRDHNLLQQLHACLAQLDASSDLPADQPPRAWWRRRDTTD